MDLKKLIKLKGVTVTRTTNLDRIELCITDKCNLNCHYCGKFCNVVSSKKDMTKSQITKFVKESIRQDKKWESIILLGGDPFLHRNLGSVISALKDYRNFSKDTSFKVRINGLSKKPCYTPKWLEVQESGVTSISKVWCNTFQAPLDRRLKGIKDCEIHAKRGLCLNRYGYAACGYASAIFRILNVDLYIKKLTDITQEKCRRQLEIACAMCGKNLEYCITTEENPRMSNSWREVLKRYAASHGPFELY